MQDACYCLRTIQVKCSLYSLLSRFYIVAVDLQCNQVMSDFPIIMVSEVQILKQKLVLVVPYLYCVHKCDMHPKYHISILYIQDKSFVWTQNIHNIVT